MQPYQSEYTSPPASELVVTPPASPGGPGTGPDEMPTTDRGAMLPAARGYRLVGGLIDRMLATYYGLTVGAVAAVGFSTYVERQTAAPGWSAYAIGAAVMAIVAFGYYATGERLFGRTFGKALTGTQVVDAAGERPATGAIILRTLARLVPFGELGIFGSRKLALHDRVSATAVVPARTLAALERRNGWPMRIVAILALVSLGGSYFVYPTYLSAATGSRIELPTRLPSDLKLTGIEARPSGGHTYYVMTFTGPQRTVVLSRQITGLDFDPELDCLYMRPTRTGLVTTAIDDSLTCPVMTSGNRTQLRTVNRTRSAQVSDDLVPDYVLKRGTYRYAIKATRGFLRDNEARALVGGFTGHTYGELKRQAGADTATPRPAPTLALTPSAAPSVAPSSTPMATVTPAPAVATPVPVQYLEVKEIGLRIPLTDIIKDLQYTYAPANFVDAHGRIQLSTASISGFAGGSCGTSKEPLGAYVVFKSKQSGIPDDQLVKAFNGYFVYYGPVQYSCGGTDAERAAVAALIDPVLAAMKQSQSR